VVEIKKTTNSSRRVGDGNANLDVILTAATQLGKNGPREVATEEEESE